MINESSIVVKRIAEVQRSLKECDAGLRSLVPLLTAAMRNGAEPERPRRLSPKARASLVLQGRYMGYMRQLKPRQKEQVRKIRGAEGVRAAIARARRLVQA